MISKGDIERVLHWTIESTKSEAYALPVGSGTVCTFDAKDGSVIVMLPDTGSSFLGTNPLVEPQAMGEMVAVHGVGDSAQIFDGTIYIKKNQRELSIKIVPNNGEPHDADLAALGKVAVRRLIADRH